jgi:hypothetical protein
MMMGGGGNRIVIDRSVVNILQLVIEFIEEIRVIHGNIINIERKIFAIRHILILIYTVVHYMNGRKKKEKRKKRKKLKRNTLYGSIHNTESP